MSIDGWMNREDVAYLYDGILLRNKKEWIWVSSSEVDEPKACYTEWSKLEKNKYSILMHISEKAMAPHFSTLAWKIPWVEEPGRLQSMGSLKSDTTERLHFYFSLSCIGEGNGNPLQCSCLEYPRNRGAWWAAIYGVTQSWTRLKWLGSSSSRNAYIWNLEKWYLWTYL